MVQKPSVEENVMTAEQSHTNQQEKDPTETDDDGKHWLHLFKTS